MASGSPYEKHVETLVQEWDEKIREFKQNAQHAGPEDAQRFNRAISWLLANREALRRGLLEFEPAPTSTGILRSADDTPEAKAAPEPQDDTSLVDELSEDYNVMRSPKERYGPGEP
jgi:hypothetical protein